jgi:hypothetical protein
VTRQTTIDQERNQLDAMIRLLSLEVDGEPTKRERPDFLIKLLNGRTVGIEIVRAINEHLATGRGARARIKRNVRAGLQAAGINAWVSVRLHENTAAALNGDPAALNREVEAIVELTRSTMTGKPASRWHVFEWIDHRYEELMGRRRYRQRAVSDLERTGIEHADAIGIHPHDEPLVTWSVHGSGQDSNIVQHAIDSKAADLPAYRQCGAEEIWLLVVGSVGTGSALFIEDVEDNVFASPYDRTIFLELFEGRCIILNTTRTDPVAAS